MFKVNYYKDDVSTSEIENDVWRDLTLAVYIKAPDMESALAKFRENYNNKVESIETAEHFDIIT